MGYMLGTPCNPCCSNACQQGPWCVSIAWSLVFDDINDGFPGANLEGSATVWVNDDVNDPEYAIRKCLNGAGADDAPFTDANCDGVEVADFCDAGSSINYGGVAAGPCLQFIWEFTGFGIGGVSLVLARVNDGGTLSEGVNDVDESWFGGDITLTGTVTFSVTGITAEVDCECQ